MTLKEILEETKDKQYPLIEEYVHYIQNGIEEHTFAGKFRVVDGKIESLDGDSYSMDQEYECYEEFEAVEDEPGICKAGDICLGVTEWVGNLDTGEK